MTQPDKKSKWDLIREQNPNHSQWYIQRFETMREEGADLVGEARFIDALAPRNATIIDAGCGPGRHVAYLDKQGHTTIGVDGDEILIAHAKDTYPHGMFICQNLAAMDLSVIDMNNTDSADIVFAAGNVMGFLNHATIPEILSRFYQVIKPGGQFVCGFGAGRGLEYEDLKAMALAAGFEVQLELESWDMKPLTSDSTFYVPIFTKTV